MSNLVQEVAAGIFSELIVLSTANEVQIKTWIGTGESDVTVWLTGILKEIPAVKGAAGLLANPIIGAGEIAIESYVGGWIAKQTPDAVFALYMATLTKLQAEAAASAGK
jgi:hypothetical protein